LSYEVIFVELAGAWNLLSSVATGTFANSLTWRATPPKETASGTEHKSVADELQWARFAIW